MKLFPGYVDFAMEDLDSDRVRRSRTASKMKKRLEKSLRRANLFVWPSGREMDARAFKLAALLGSDHSPGWMSVIRNDIDIASEVVNSAARFSADIMRHEVTKGSVRPCDPTRECVHQDNFPLKLRFRGGVITVPSWVEIEQWISSIGELYPAPLVKDGPWKQRWEELSECSWWDSNPTVSYTHLTLPTIYSV